MKNSYRLEFNEKQQKFHLDNYTHSENSFGWVTIIENCTDKEFEIFESFINKSNKKSFTKEYLLKSVLELKQFIENLMEYNLNISSYV